MKLHKLKHCCFLLETKEVKLLIDPALSFFDANENYKNYDFDAILVSHAHFDHFEDVVSLAKSRNVEVYCVMSLKNHINKNFSEVVVNGFQPGGTLQIKDLKVKVFQAQHENFLRDFTPVGPACFFAFDDGVNTLAYLADSAFNPNYYHVEKLMSKTMDYIIINVGTVSTLNCDDAFIVSNEIFKNAITIPAHYEMWSEQINIFDMKEKYQKNNLKIILANEFSQIF